MAKLLAFLNALNSKISIILFFDVFNKIKSIILNLYKRFINLMCKDSIILNIISLIAVCFILYLFIITLSFDIGLLSLIVSFVISFVISTFVLDKFTYSEYIYIRLFQRFLIYLLFFILSIFVYYSVLYLFDFIPTIYCSGGEDLILNKDNVTKIAEVSIDEDMYTLKVNKKAMEKKQLKMRYQ